MEGILVAYILIAFRFQARRKATGKGLHTV